jgi:hypothetical protein
MCDDKKCGCQEQGKEKPNPKECTPEQIRKCHGDSGDHPCEETGCSQ